MDGQSHYRRCGREPYPADPERRAARAARRRERAARGEAEQPATPGNTYRAGAPVDRARRRGLRRAARRSRATGAGRGVQAALRPAGRGQRRPWPAGRADRAREVGGDEGVPRRRTPLWAKLNVTLGAALSLLSLMAIVGVQAAIARYAGNIQQEDLLGPAAAQTEPGRELEGCSTSSCSASTTARDGSWTTCALTRSWSSTCRAPTTRRTSSPSRGTPGSRCRVLGHEDHRRLLPRRPRGGTPGPAAPSWWRASISS